MKESKTVFRSRLAVDAYGDGGFRFGGMAMEGSILLLSRGMEPWPVQNSHEINADILQPVFQEADEIEFLLLGTGPTMTPVAAALREALEKAGIGLELMDTGAACRLYNVLIAEERAIAAALIAIP